MFRRRYLALAGTVLVGFAGCSGEDAPGGAENVQATDTATASPTDSPTNSPTNSPTVSPTPETRPEVLFANLVSEFESYGDVQKNKIESATAGDVILVGARYRYYIHDGTLHTFDQIDIRDDNDTRVGSQTYEDEQIFEGNGYELFENALGFDTRGWETGSYTALVRIRDEVTGKVSNTEEASFELK